MPTSVTVNACARRAKAQDRKGVLEKVQHSQKKRGGRRGGGVPQRVPGFRRSQRRSLEKVPVHFGAPPLRAADRRDPPWHRFAAPPSDGGGWCVTKFCRQKETGSGSALVPNASRQEAEANLARTLGLLLDRGRICSRTINVNACAQPGRPTGKEERGPQEKGRGGSQERAQGSRRGFRGRVGLGGRRPDPCLLVPNVSRQEAEAYTSSFEGVLDETGLPQI